MSNKSLREAAQQALDAMCAADERFCVHDIQSHKLLAAIESLRAALAQPDDKTQPGERVSSAAGRIADAIKEVLLHHRMSHTVDDDGDALPLIDMLCRPDSNDVSTGRDEIELLVDSIYNEVLTAPQPPAPQPFQPDWMNYKQGLEDGKAEAEREQREELKDEYERGRKAGITQVYDSMLKSEQGADYPPLPSPGIMLGGGDFFTDDQMRAYVAADRAARGGAA